jgi:hypothetical protein
MQYSLGETAYDGRFGFYEYARQFLRNGGVQFLFDFPNGHTVSIIRNPYSIASDLGCYEGIVIKRGLYPWCDDKFVTDATPLDNPEMVKCYLQDVMNLPHASVCPAELYDSIF